MNPLNVFKPKVSSLFGSSSREKLEPVVIKKKIKNKIKTSSPVCQYRQEIFTRGGLSKKMKSSSFPRRISGTLSLPCSEPLPLLKSHFKTFLFALAYDWLKPHSSFFPLSPRPHPSTLPSPSTVRTLARLFPPSIFQPLACYPAVTAWHVRVLCRPARVTFTWSRQVCKCAGLLHMGACTSPSFSEEKEEVMNFSGTSAWRGTLQVVFHKLQTQKLEKQNTKRPCDRPAKIPTPSLVSLGRLQVKPAGEVGIKPRPNRNCCFTFRIEL